MTFAFSSQEHESIASHIEKNLHEIGLIQADPDSYVYDYFEEIKRQVDLRRENLKQEIDEYSEKLIGQINKTQAECRELAQKVNVINSQIEELKDEMNNFLDELPCYHSAIDLKATFDSKLDHFKMSLTEQKEFYFKCNDSSIEDIFGCFSFDMKLNSSQLLDLSEANDLMRLCEFKMQDWKLVYRATDDGFSSRNFHEKCDGVASTLTVVKATSGNIFGGFTEKAWSSVGEYVEDHKAFVFSLVNKDNKPFKTKITYSLDAIYCHRNEGPSFGGGDLYISSNSNINTDSSSFFSLSYKHPDYVKDTNEAESILAGSRNFQTVQIEVYAKRF